MPSNVEDESLLKCDESDDSSDDSSDDIDNW